MMTMIDSAGDYVKNLSAFLWHVRFWENCLIELTENKTKSWSLCSNLSWHAQKQWLIQLRI